MQESDSTSHKNPMQDILHICISGILVNEIKKFIHNFTEFLTTNEWQIVILENLLDTNS